PPPPDEIDITLTTFAFTPKITDALITRDTVQVGVIQPAQMMVKVELPDAGFPKEHNPGVSVKVNVNRVPVVSTPGTTVKVEPNTGFGPESGSLTKFVKDGGSEWFAFPLTPLTTVNGGTVWLRPTIGNDLTSCVNPFVATPVHNFDRPLTVQPPVKVTMTGPAAVCKGKESEFTVRAENLSPLGELVLSIRSGGGGRATFSNGLTDLTLSGAQLSSGLPVTIRIKGTAPSSFENDMILQAQVRDAGLYTPAPVDKQFSVADSIVTKEVMIIAWINPDAPDLKATVDNTTGVSLELITALNNPLGCGSTLRDWKNGIPTHLVDSNGNIIEANRRYANAWLIRKGGNQKPPTDLRGLKSDGFARKTEEYKLFARLQIEMCALNGKLIGFPTILKRDAGVGETPEPCTGLGIIALDGEYAPDNNTFTPQSDVRIGLLNRGRIGSDGQKVHVTVNRRIAPHIWSNIIFSVLRNDGSYDEVSTEMYPTYWIYVDGLFIEEITQKELEDFIQQKGIPIPN
ncbi:MAG: hypothetical protein ABIN58_03065, partial [candidate division WOR-3 bacterium]